MEFSITDTLRQSIEVLSGGKNTVMYDAQGNPNIMVCVPKFDGSVVGLSAGTHPAFIIDEDHNEVNEIWVGKYVATRGNNGGCSVWHGLPTFSQTTPDEGREMCRKKGKGWHMMSNLEWSAVALSSWVNGHNRPGIYGRHRKVFYKDKDAYDYFFAPSIRSDDMNFSSDGTPNGIFHMNGLIRQFVDGIYVSKDNRIYYWGDSENSPINCFDSDHYVDASIEFDKDPGHPFHIDNDHDRGEKLSDYVTKFIDMRVSGHLDAKMKDAVEKLLLVPTSTMKASGNPPTGEVSVEDIYSEGRYTIVRCYDSGCYGSAGTMNGASDMFTYWVSPFEQERYRNYRDMSFRPVYISK